MPSKCQDCGEDALYDRPEGGKKCALCGWKWKPDGSVANNYPVREADADCGDIISNHFDGVSRACVRKKNCSDGSACTVSPNGIAELGAGIYMVSCYHHN